MAEAEGRLNKAIREGLADSLNIQNIDGLERVVEMDVALLKVGKKTRQHFRASQNRPVMEWSVGIR